VLRATALTVALVGVYGTAAADADNILACNGPSSCTASPYTDNYGKTSAGWAVTGANGAAFTVQGSNITTSGSGAKGVLSSGANTNVTVQSATIETNGSSGHGVQAYGAGSTLTLNNTNITTLSASYAVGVSAQVGGLVTGSNNTIVTNGEYGSGVEVDRGGVASLTGGSITTHGANAAGARAISGQGSTAPGSITLDGTAITTDTGIGLMAGDVDDGIDPTAGNIVYKNGTVSANGAGYEAARVKYDSTLNLENATLKSSGGNGITADGTGSTVTATNSTISTSASGSKTGGVTSPIYAVDATGGATAEITGGSISATGGQYSRGILVGVGSSVTTTNTAISTTGSNSHAVHAYASSSGASPAPSITINGGSITTTGDNSWGLYSQNSGNITSTADITTGGLAGFGAFAEEGAGITLNGGSITTTGGALSGTIGSFGVLSKNGSTVNVNNVAITTSGALADGLRADTDGATGGTIVATSTTVNTSGANASGISVYGSHSATSSVTMAGGSVTASGTGSSAVYLQDRATVSLTGTTLNSSGATFTSTITGEDSQSITLGSGTTVASNNGTLLNVTRSGSGEDGMITLTLQDGSFAQGNVSDKDGSNQVTVTKGANASWAGVVVDSTTDSVTDSTPTDYSNTGNVVVGSTTPVTFTGTTSVGGDFSGATGGSTTFSGSTTISGNLVGAQGSTTSFSGPTTVGAVTGGSGSSIHFTGSSTTIQGNVSGNQGTQITFSQGGSTTIGGSVNLSGSGTSTHGGTIGNPIIVQGDVTVGSGATLGGNITSNGALGGSGGTIGPGNSVGVQSYATSAGFTGTYKAEVNAAGNSDLIIIRSGNFDLSGIGLTVGQENGNGGYVLNHDYTIVQTPGGSVVNTFQSTGLDSSFAGTLVQLDPVKYGAQDVKVSLSVNNSAIEAKRAGFSANQNAALDGVLSVAGHNTAADAALQSTDSGGALNQLSGESFASTASALLASSGLVQRTLTQRLQGNVGSGMRPGALTAQAGGALPAGSLPQSEAQPLWAQVVGNWNTLSSDGNAAKVSTDLGGVFVGGDAGVGSGWRVGGALGYTHGNIDVDDRSSRSKVDSYTVSLYGGNSWAAGKGKVNFLAGAAYTWNKVDSRRTVTVGGNQTLRADYNGNAAQVFTELGYALPVGAHSVLEPYAGLAWLNQHTQGFSESGGAAALSGNSQTDSVTTFTLGLRGKTQLTWGADKSVTVFGGLGWRHASGDTTPDRKLAFIQGSGATFRVAGAPIARNAAVVDAGLEASVGRMTSMGLSYSGQFGDGNTDHAGMLYVKTRF